MHICAIALHSDIVQRDSLALRQDKSGKIVTVETDRSLSPLEEAPAMLDGVRKG